MVDLTSVLAGALTVAMLVAIYAMIISERGG